MACDNRGKWGRVNEIFQIIVTRGDDSTSLAEWEGGKDVGWFCLEVDP